MIRELISKSEFQKRFDQVVINYNKGLKILEAIEYFSKKRERHLKDSRTWLLHFEIQKQLMIHKADICQRAINRLTESFNLLNVDNYL